MKLPYLLGLSAVAFGAVLAGCGGGGGGGVQNLPWTTRLFVGDLENYEFVITRNETLPGDRPNDECSSLYGDNPAWCRFFDDGSVDFTVDPTRTPYAIFIRRVDTLRPTVSVALERGQFFDRRNNVQIASPDFILLWGVDQNGAQFIGDVITGRARKAGPAPVKANWGGKRPSPTAP